MSDDTPEARLWAMVDDLRVAMLTTEKAGRGLTSRPMYGHYDAASRTILFITKIENDVNDEIADHAEVNLAYADTKGDSYASISGTARTVRDVAKLKELWNPFAEAWMPEGPEAPSSVLIAVTPGHATFWESPSKLVQLFDIARANVTQTPARTGEVVDVDL